MPRRHVPICQELHGVGSLSAAAECFPSSCSPLFVAFRGASRKFFGGPADRRDMKTSPSLDQFAWLFTRGEESVRLQNYEQGDGFRLVINGPGPVQVSHEFDSMSSLMIFVTNYQERLRANNFKLQASAERRADPRTPREGIERRRGDR